MLGDNVKWNEYLSETQNFDSLSVHFREISARAL